MLVPTLKSELVWILQQRRNAAGQVWHNNNQDAPSLCFTSICLTDVPWTAARHKQLIRDTKIYGDTTCSKMKTAEQCLTCPRENRRQQQFYHVFNQGGLWGIWLILENTFSNHRQKPSSSSSSVSLITWQSDDTCLSNFKHLILWLNNKHIQKTHRSTF